MVEPHTIKPVQTSNRVAVSIVVARIEGVCENQHIITEIIGSAHRVDADYNAPMSAELDVLNHNRLAKQKIFHDKFLKLKFVHRRLIQTALNVPTNAFEKFNHIAQARAD